MLDLVAQYAVVRDGRDQQHIIRVGTPGPPWSALCTRQVLASRASFARAVADVGLRCSDCVVKYKEQILAPRTFVGKDGPPGEFVGQPRRQLRPRVRVPYTAADDPPRSLGS